MDTEALDNAMKILLIEGSMGERLDLVKQLQKMGHEVVCTNKAAESFQLIEASTPRLILLDASRTDFDEEKLTQQLHQVIEGHIPIIFLVDEVNPEKILSCVQSGGSDYLVKPVNASLLKAKILAMQRCASAMGKTDTTAEPEIESTDLDKTTGVANRNALDNCLQHETARCTRYNLPLSAIIIGIDHFKSYNDKYGHLSGDKCLRKIAGILEKEIKRPTDLVSRLREDMFCILLSDTGSEGARFVADRIFNSIREMAIPHRDNDASEIVTLSIGVASIFPDPCTTPSGIIDNALEAMEQAKSEGRNRIVFYRKTTSAGA